MGSPRGSDLDAYRKKRDPQRTPEPFGGAAATPRSAPRFVVQKHWARNLHFDFRLELDGVLKSWAVPKGPSTHVEEKRLAVHVEDHPLEYIDFEGVIPAGNYGAGSVIVWDRGAYGSFKPEDLSEQYARGKMELELHGFKLRGRWTLVRMSNKDKEWLLLKKADGFATSYEAIDRYPNSVITGLTVEDMRDVPAYLESLRARVAELGAPRRAVDPRNVSFTLATLAKDPPEGAEWCFEIKYDGVRVLAVREGDDVLLFGRSGESITARYPEIAAGLRALPVEHFVIDGEIVAEREDGRPSFQRLQARMGLNRPRDVEAAMQRVPVRAMFFDCLALEGHDLRKVPLADRKALLSRVVPPLAVVQGCEHVLEHGRAFFDAASDVGLEGIVAKKLASSYAGKRTTDWLKVKCDRHQEFVIGGWTEPQGSRARFGALHVGLYQGSDLVYVTKVGTGFDDAELDRVWKLLQPLARATPPFVGGDPPRGREHHWAEPRLVCEVRFTEWTRAGGLRHPLYLGLREDKRPEDCVKETEVVLDAETDAEPSGDVPGDGAGGSDGASVVRERPSRARPKPAPAPAPVREVKVTNREKIFWPEGYTKGDLIDYYESVASLLLPYLRDRPLVLTRYPDGIGGKSFFQKDAPVYVPDWIRTETIYASDAEREIRYFVVDDPVALRYVANMGTIPLHVWSARVGSITTPDWMVLDLDPKSAPFSDVIRVAKTVHRILDELELPNWVKTSGASGLHVLVPMGRRYTHEETRTFARLLAVLVVEAEPEISTIARAIGSREGKVYVDFGQNGHGNTIVSPYSVRPLPGAPASCPLQWSEVNARLDPAKFTIRTIPKRFEKMEDPMRAVLGEGIDMAAAIARIERRVAKRGEKEAS